MQHLQVCLFVHLKLFIHFAVQVNRNVWNAEDRTVDVDQTMLHSVPRLHYNSHNHIHHVSQLVSVNKIPQTKHVHKLESWTLHLHPAVTAMHSHVSLQCCLTSV